MSVRRKFIRKSIRRQPSLLPIEEFQMDLIRLRESYLEEMAKLTDEERAARNAEARVKLTEDLKFFREQSDYGLTPEQRGYRLGLWFEQKSQGLEPDMASLTDAAKNMPVKETSHLDMLKDTEAFFDELHSFIPSGDDLTETEIRMQLTDWVKTVVRKYTPD